MKPSAFSYVQPETIDQAVALLAEHGADARVLAGGQSLMAMLNLRLASPELLVDISRMPELSRIDDSKGSVTIGAAVTQAELLAWPALSRALPFVALALPFVGHFQTRNRGTICGSLAHSDPSSELPLSLALLGGEVALRSKSGTRWLKAADFQQGLLQTARRDDELITAVRFPKASPDQAFAFREVARRHGDFAIVGAGLVRGPDGAMTLGIAGMTDTAHVERVPGGLSQEDRTEWVNALAWRLRGSDDIHATARYRRDLLRRLVPAMVEEMDKCTA